MTKTLPDRKAKQRCLTQDQWQTLMLDQHRGYITWAEYEANIAKLKANAAGFGLKSLSQSSPRSAPPMDLNLALIVSSTKRC